MFQSHNLFPHKTVLQNVTEGPVNAQKRPKDEAEAEAVELLEQVGLAGKRDQYPFQILEKGPPAEVIGDPKEERTRQFLDRILNPL